MKRSHCLFLLLLNCEESRHDIRFRSCFWTCGQYKGLELCQSETMRVFSRIQRLKFFSATTEKRIITTSFPRCFPCWWEVINFCLKFLLDYSTIFYIQIKEVRFHPISNYVNAIKNYSRAPWVRKFGFLCIRQR